MLLKQFKLPLILAAIGLMLFSLNVFMNTAKVGGVNEQKVQHYEQSFEQATKAETQRNEQATGDAINVAEKLRRDNAIKKTFADYKASLIGKAQPEEVASHESQPSNNMQPDETRGDKSLANCQLNADDFSVLIAAYQTTFGDQLATDTRGQPAPAGAQRSATGHRLTAGPASVQPGADGVYSVAAKQLQQPGNSGEGTATATG